MVCLTSDHMEGPVDHFSIMAEPQPETFGGTGNRSVVRSTFAETTDTNTAPSTSFSISRVADLNDRQVTSSTVAWQPRTTHRSYDHSQGSPAGQSGKFGGGADEDISDSVFGGGRLPNPHGPPSIPGPSHSKQTAYPLETSSDGQSDEPEAETTVTSSDAKHKLKSKLKSKLGNIDPSELFAEKPRPQEEPSESDEERKSRRRHQNMMAARRTRQRRKEVAEGATKEVQTLECQNTSLKWEIRQLEKERERLEELLKDHEKTCSRRKSR